ncbi:cell wall-active antibiotics response protein LiaF [Ornithinibacillus halotolerans]|uniref:Transporter n=1 Tax=Ornithinibacillus halotolerans TaxID=1274357 RepID=A0A916W6X4_9BACI|nr:cell wall-active antibiotics response protein LiaF [Ornithinibacillus halotolerans]GGA72316.1 transporter [Ornithinibacillus halotolerans]
MFRRLKTDTLNWILIVGVILLIVEIFFNFGGAIIPAIFSSIMAYVGWKNFSKLWGKILLGIGLVILVFSILNLLVVRFLIIVVIVLFIMDYVDSKKKDLKPDLPSNVINNDRLIKVNPFFQNKLYGDQNTEDTVYQWRDVNIHGAFGDRMIDLSNTVLPNDTAVISIRHVMGNIEIYVPYDVEVSIHHSSVFGRAYIFGDYQEDLLNKSLLYQTENYDTTYPRVKIITSLFSGDIEVKRI